MHDRCACRLSEFGDQGLLAITKSIGVPTLQRIRRTATEPAETQSAELRNGAQTILGTRRQILRIVGGLLRMTDPVRATATGTAGSGSFLLLRHQFCLGERCMHTQ